MDANGLQHRHILWIGTLDEYAPPHERPIMTNMSDPTIHQPLGVGKIVSDSFQTFVSNIVTIIILGVLPAALGIIIKAIFLGFGPHLVDPEIFIINTSWLGFAFSTVVDMVFYGMFTAMLVLMAYDAKLGRSRSIGGYLSSALGVLFPVIVMSLVVALVLSLGFLALIIPGIWLYGVLAVTVPAIVIERADYGALGRSAALTKEYRWPVIGLLIIIGIIVAVFSGIIGAVVTMLGSFGFGLAGTIVLTTLLNGLGYGLSSIAAALVYARLREIKEGVHVDQLAAVFD